jgi:FdhE protein
MISTVVRTDPWPLRRQRTDELLTRYAFASELLGFYRALLPVQEKAYRAAEADHPSPADLPRYVVDRVMPDVVDVTVADGPRRLRDGVVERFCSADLPDLVRRWLSGTALSPFEVFLARASAGPVLEAGNGDGDGAVVARPPTQTHPTLPRARKHVEGYQDLNQMEGYEGGGESEDVDTRYCPGCGGLPQLSYFAVSGEALVTGPRYLLCSRCGQTWVFSRMVCAGCGERSGNQMPIYRDEAQFPHVRVDACQSCHRYLLTFDLRHDKGAVPVVDELACLPLDLYARDRGFAKITPNLLGN